MSWLAFAYRLRSLRTGTLTSSLKNWIRVSTEAQTTERSPLSNDAHTGRDCWLGRAGAVAIVTAVCAPILVMIVGFVVDFSYASYINQVLARAADDATLGSVSQTAATAGGGYGDLGFLQLAGTNYFSANTAQLGITGINFSLSVTSDGSGGVVASSTYSYNVPTFFSGFIGINTIPVSGKATTSARPTVYVNYYILIDTSQSMGIASTAADMTRLFNLVISSGNQSGGETGCVFGCHVTQGTQPQTNEYLAHSVASPPIQLRIDAAVAAVQSIISQAQTIAGTTQNIKFGLYTMQQDPNSPLASTVTTVATPSTNYAALLNAASTIDLGNNNSFGRGDSNFPNELTSFNTILTTAGVTANGSGASATSPLNYFIIVTDGVTDTFGYCNGHTHCTGPIDPSYCTPLKSKGTVGVIYTIYSPIWANNNASAGVLEGNYSDLVAPFSSQIQPALQSCATSSTYFYQANDGPDIIAAVQTLFQNTQPSSARITQ